MFDPKTFFTGNHFSEESDHEAMERTIIVKRTDLRFNNQECQVLNFSETTIMKQLKKEEERRKTLEVINTEVYQELISPLKTKADLVEQLMFKV